MLNGQAQQRSARSSTQSTGEDAKHHSDKKDHEPNIQPGSLQDETHKVSPVTTPLDVELAVKPKRTSGKAKESPIPSGRSQIKSSGIAAPTSPDYGQIAIDETEPRILTAAGGQSQAIEDMGGVRKQVSPQEVPGSASGQDCEPLRRTGSEPNQEAPLARDAQEPSTSAGYYVSGQQWTNSETVPGFAYYGKQDSNAGWWSSQASWWDKPNEGWHWARSSWQPADDIKWGPNGSDHRQGVSWNSWARAGSEERSQNYTQTRQNRQTWWEEQSCWGQTRQRTDAAPRSAWDVDSSDLRTSFNARGLSADSLKQPTRLLDQPQRDAFFAAGWDPDALYRRPDAEGAWLQDPMAYGERRRGLIISKETESRDVLGDAHLWAQPREPCSQWQAEKGKSGSCSKEEQDVRVSLIASAGVQGSKLGQGQSDDSKQPVAASVPKVHMQSKSTSTDAYKAELDPKVHMQSRSTSTDAYKAELDHELPLQVPNSSLLRSEPLDLGNISPEEFGNFAMHAIGEVVHDLLQLKYNTGLDIVEFVETGARSCGEYALLSVPRLLQKINSQTELRFLDRRREHLLQLRLEWRDLRDFDSLRRTVRLVPGTASAVAIITGGGGHVLDVVAVFRVAYSDSSMVVGRSGRGGSQPLRHFGDGDLCGSVAIDPFIVSMCPVTASPLSQLSGVVPVPAPEYASLEMLLQDGKKRSTAAANNSTSRVPPNLLAIMHALAPTQDVLKKIAELLERPDVEPESVLEVLQKLVEWLKHEPHATLVRRGLAATKGQAGVVAALRRHRSQCAFAATACRVIGWASRHHVENAVLFVDSSAATEVCSVLEMHRADKDLHRHGLYAIGCLAHYGGGGAQAMAADGLGIVHRSMGTHRDSPSVQVNGCEVLRCLAESGAAPMEELGKVAMDAKRAFPRDQSVHRAADALLTLVVPRTVCAITMLMDTQLADAEVQNSGARTLGQLAAYGGVAWRGAAAGAVSRIVRAMTNHRDNVALQAVGLWALGRLSERVEAPTAGMYDAATRAKAKHKESALVQRHADQLLAYLSSRP